MPQRINEQHRWLVLFLPFGWKDKKENRRLIVYTSCQSKEDALKDSRLFDPFEHENFLAKRLKEEVLHPTHPVFVVWPMEFGQFQAILLPLQEAEKCDLPQKEIFLLVFEPIF